MPRAFRRARLPSRRTPGPSEASRGPTRLRACGSEPPTRQRRTRRARKPRKSSSGEVHPHALDLRVLLERVVAALAAEAGLFVAAEGEAGVVEIVSVHPD